jgi:hypothetical protein
LHEVEKAGTQDPAHDEWFRRQVDQAITDANRPNAEWESQDEVKARSKIKQAEWQAKAKAGEKATA